MRLGGAVFKHIINRLSGQLSQCKSDSLFLDLSTWRYDIESVWTVWIKGFTANSQIWKYNGYPSSTVNFVTKLLTNCPSLLMVLLLICVTILILRIRQELHRLTALVLRTHQDVYELRER